MPSIINTYQLITPTVNTPEVVINNLLNKSKIPNQESVTSGLERQFYHISQANNGKSLMYRSKLLQMLIQLSKVKY